jgi:hypothetical protein
VQVCTTIFSDNHKKRKIIRLVCTLGDVAISERSTSSDVTSSENFTACLEIETSPLPTVENCPMEIAALLLVLVEIE